MIRRLMMQLNGEQQKMVEGREGRGVQKAMEILIGMGDAVGAEKMVQISYAHLMPPDLMFFPYGKQGEWAHEMTKELIQDIRSFRVPTTIEPMFCDLRIARELQYREDQIAEMGKIQGNAISFYEKVNVFPTYTAMPFLYYQTKLGEHVSIAESIATLWFNTMFGSRCERDDGVTALAAAITGYVPLTGAHLDEHRHAEVLVKPGKDIDFVYFSDADWDAYSLAASRKCKSRRPAFLGIPSAIGLTALKHLLAVIAVESGLAVMHIVGITPEAETLQAAVGGSQPLDEYVIGKQDMEEAYALANTAKDGSIAFVLLGCPHLTLREMRDLGVVLEGKKVSGNVKLIAVTTRLLLEQAEDMGFARAIRDAGGILTTDMCIAFAGSNVKGTIATNSIKAVFFYTGFCASSPNEVKFGSIQDCAKSALSGKWEGRF
jgi:cis-L-3-hydroxyproline dehydratase